MRSGMLLSRTNAHRAGYGQPHHPRPAPSSTRRVTLRALDATAPVVTTPPPVTTPLPWDIGSSATQGLREGMEDDLTVLYEPTIKQLFCGVFDGHGGPSAALWLSRELHGLVTKEVETEVKGKPADAASADELKRALETSFVSADKALMSHLQTLGTDVLSNAGATATVMLASQERLVVANIGDSQAFILRNGKALPLTIPHRVYGSGPDVRTEVDRVRATGAWIHDGRVCNILAVSRAFGDWEFKSEGLPQLLKGGVERGYWPQDFADKQSFKSDPVIVTPAVSQTDLQAADEFAVMATDGLWDVMEPADVMRWARNKFKLGKNAQEVAEGLVGVALKRYSSDNISVVVIDFKGADHWQAKGNGKPSWLGGLFK